MTQAQIKKIIEQIGELMLYLGFATDGVDYHHEISVLSEALCVLRRIEINETAQMLEEVVTVPSAMNAVGPRGGRRR